MIPKINLKQIALTMEKLKDDPEKCKALFRYWFSDPKNIDVFSQFIFPVYIQGEVQWFHKEWYEIMNKPGNDAWASFRGSAKAQSLNSKVLTPLGWMKFKDLKKGTILYDCNGKTTKITNLHPIQEMDLFEVTTRDGRKTLCNLDHLWNVQCQFNRKEDIITKSLREILKKYKSNRLDKRNNKNYIEYHYFLPTPKPIEHREKEYLIDPYTLGLWLGDGNSRDARITTPDPEIFNYIPFEVTKNNNYLRYNIKGLMTLLKKKNLLLNKHIPREYLYGSVKQREALLQGLIDTDGTIDKNGMQFSFTNKNEKIIDTLVELIRSLGGTCTKTEQLTRFDKQSEYKKSFRINCRVPKEIIPCRLSRKRNIWKGSIKTKNAIINIEYKKTDLGRCISVDNETGTYITDDYMVTHNSTTLGLIYISWCIVNQKEPYIVYISQNHTKTVQFIEPIRIEFRNNKRLRWLYGNLSPTNTKDDDGRDREDCVDINECRIEAVSFEKNLRGFKYKNMRPTLIIGDDIDSDERVVNPVLREKDRDKLNKVIIPSLDINGRWKMIGTILHHDSLLKNQLNLLNGKIYRAIDDNGEPLWKDRFTIEKLEEIKQQIGSSAFQSEFLNNPTDNESSLIKREWVEQCFVDKSVEEIEFEELYLGVDFAFSDKVSADNSAFVDVGVNYNSNNTIKNLVLLNIEWAKGLSLKSHWEKISNKYLANNHDMILLEENSIKGSIDDIRDLKIPYRMFWMGSKDSSKYTHSMNKSKTISKINAINRLAVLFEYKKIIIPYKTKKEKQIADKFLNEVCSWTLMDGKLVETGVHPDSPIGFILVNEYLKTSRGVA